MLCQWPTGEWGIGRTQLAEMMPESATSDAFTRGLSMRLIRSPQRLRRVSSLKHSPLQAACAGSPAFSPDLNSYVAVQDNEVMLVLRLKGTANVIVFSVRQRLVANR